ncbi:3 5-cyclic nucleotide phosphodiesterase domain-containing protein [Cyclospora cayetanensis]|uniref:Phosphodiesterase n=1 Tax=Cyclospora cayetanensis TaxID=88456 RepID=A0A1D3CXJ1_9EIME|nr:3 5-cyclic nucleotide phosphodiesterase domain-containing protein [Cyclospora cayetanensis]
MEIRHVGIRKRDRSASSRARLSSVKLLPDRCRGSSTWQPPFALRLQTSTDTSQQSATGQEEEGSWGVSGRQVAQKTYALLNLVSLVKSRQARDMALIIVAGLCHDIGHPGRNNALFSNAMEPLALLYNDRAVLENYHACLTFKTLEKQDCDIFVTLKTREYLMVRTQIIELILATDMKGHFETVSRFRPSHKHRVPTRREKRRFCGGKGEGREMSAEQGEGAKGEGGHGFSVMDVESECSWIYLFFRMFIKASDISHCGVEWGQHFEWCQRVLNEFYDQGDEERLRCLPISPLCDREKHGDAAKSQMGFINFVAKPLFDELAAVDISGTVEKEVMTNLRSNASRWEALSNAGVVIPLFLDQWPASLLTSSSFPPLTSAAIASAAATTAANAAAPTGSKVQLINQKIKLQKSAEGVNVTKIDLRSLLSQGEAGRHRHSSHQQNNPQPIPGTSTNKVHTVSQLLKSPGNVKNKGAPTGF